MALNKVVVVKVSLLLFLMGFTATVDARFDPNSLVAQVLTDVNPIFFPKSSTCACCDKCLCTRSTPPQCRCTDIGETCHSACKSCICTRSYPPQCRCTDINDFCYPSCSSTTAGVEAH